MSAVLIVVALRMGEGGMNSSVSARCRAATRSCFSPPSGSRSSSISWWLWRSAWFSASHSPYQACLRYHRGEPRHSRTMLERPEQIAQGKIIPDGVLVYRIFGPFLFGAAEKWRTLSPRWATGRKSSSSGLPRHRDGCHRPQRPRKRGRAHEAAKERGHPERNPPEPLQLLKKAGFIEVVGRENFCATFDDSLPAQLNACAPAWTPSGDDSRPGRRDPARSEPERRRAASWTPY